MEQLEEKKLLSLSVLQVSKKVQDSSCLVIYKTAERTYAFTKISQFSPLWKHLWKHLRFQHCGIDISLVIHVCFIFFSVLFWRFTQQAKEILFCFNLSLKWVRVECCVPSEPYSVYYLSSFHFQPKLVGLSRVR